MSKIEWTGETWNPVIGCDKVSPGCKNCYAIRTAWIRMHNPKMAKRYAGTVEKTQSGQLNWTGKITLVDEVLLKPLKTKKPTTFFVNSMSDLFHKDVPFEFIRLVFGIMSVCQNHTFQILTKRPERMLEYFQWQIKFNPDEEDPAYYAYDLCINHGIETGCGSAFETEEWPLPNVWLGVSVENQQTADERIPVLLQVPAAIRFLSCEPLLGPVDLTQFYISKDKSITHNALTGVPYDWDYEKEFEEDSIDEKIHWVIVGGESGPGARPMHPDWAIQLRNQCKDAGVPFFFKQWGEYVPMLGHTNGVKVKDEKFTFPDGTIMGYAGKKAAGRLLYGEEYNQFPIVK